MELNSKQKLAAETIDGPVLVLAGPGTGKTELLSVRAANIIKSKKAKPENILILTYTNAAAKAMKERLVKLLRADAYNIETATFHSFANTVVLESDEAAEYIQERVQITDIEQIKLLEYILDNTDGIDKIRPFRAPYAFEREISQRITELKREGVSPAQFAEIIKKAEPDGAYIEEKHIERLKALATVYKLYEEYKAGKNKALFDDRGRYDYDDMIIFAVEAIRNEPELAGALRKQYTYIMVDEFQDTNGAQMDLLFELAGKGLSPQGTVPNLCCVGDDDQSIFRFQGASVANFRELKKHFPNLKEIPLEKNYRSTKEIISLAGRIINNLPVKERVHAKELAPETDFKKKTIEYDEFTTETEELLFIARRIKEIAKKEEVPLDEVAVLVRQRDDILKIVDTFLRAGIPYATDGKEDIAGEKRVRQMLDVLYFAHTPDIEVEQKDAYLYRILTSDYMRIPMNDILRFIASVRVKKYDQRKKGEAPTVSMFSELMGLAQGLSPQGTVPTSFGKGGVSQSDTSPLVALLYEAEIKPVHAMLMQYIKDAGVMKFILEKYDKNNLLRIRDLRALTSFVNMVKESDIARPGITLKEFIDELETRKAHGMSLKGELVTATQEGVRIYTAHGSKGLEFHTVFIPFCLEKKRWPKRPQGVSIPLPPEVYKSKEIPTDKDILKQLDYYDETRLFYVASTRAKANLIYTASPTESAIPSSYLTGVADGRAAAHAAAAAGGEEGLLKAALETTDAQDPFVGTSKVLSDLVQDLSLNPTALNNYINCPRKYLYDDVLMLPSGKKQSLVFGNCAHKALEDTYNKFMKTGKFPDFAFFKEAFKRELAHEAPEAAIKTACERQVETFKAWFKEESRLPLKPLGLEKRLVVMLEDDLKFSGKYDKTEPAGAAVRVIDYKTGEPDKHVKGINNSLAKKIPVSSDEFEGYLRQLIAYKLLFDRDKNESQGRKVKEGVLVFLDPAKESVAKHDLEAGGFVKKKVELTDDMVAELESAIKDVRRRIRKLDFAKLPEIDEKPGKCGKSPNTCNFYDICWR